MRALNGDNLVLFRLQLIDIEEIILKRLSSVKCPIFIDYVGKSPYSSLPSSIPVKRLRVLRVSSMLEALWQQE